MRLDDEGLVSPIGEAWRPGFRYFSLINLHGLHLRGTGEFKRPKRQDQESSEDYQIRVDASRQAWWRAASPKTRRGIVDIQLEMRLLGSVNAASLENEFIEFADYRQIAEGSPELREIFYRTAPNRWPVSYDERAHKPHRFTEPAVWKDTAAAALRVDILRARLEWDWCNADAPLRARIIVPRGQILPPGPNRSGRSDHGPASIEVVEGDLG